MDTWSSIRDFCRRWKREIRLYGIGALLFLSALVTNRLTAGLIVLVGVLLLDAMHRWGEDLRLRGEEAVELRRRRNRERMAERIASWFTPKQPPEEAGPSPATTRVILRPGENEEDLPESPAPLPLEEPEKSPPDVKPPVTHGT